MDISQSVVPYPLFEDREGTLSFYVENDYGYWYSRYEFEISPYLHGTQCMVILDDQPDFYYEGRFFLEEWQNTKDRSTVVIRYKLRPYKYEVLSSTDSWLWDPFDFELGVINDNCHIVVNEEYRAYLFNRQEPVTPTFVCSSNNVQVGFNGHTYPLKAGSNRNPLILLQPGENQIDLYGFGTVDIIYRGGML